MTAWFTVRRRLTLLACLAVGIALLIGGERPSAAFVLSGLAARITAVVDRSVATKEYRYTYTVKNVSDDTSIAAVGINLPVGAAAHTRSGWRWPSLFTGVVLHTPDFDPLEALAPGRSLNGLELVSRLLPGLTEATVWPALAPVDWESAPLPGRSYPLIGAVIGSSSGQAVPAALDILRHVHQNLVPALTADHDVSGDRAGRALQSAILALQSSDTSTAERTLHGLLADVWERASEWRAEVHQALELDVNYTLDLLRQGGTIDPQLPAAAGGEDAWVYPGVMVPSTSDLSKFFDETALAFVGTLEQVSPEFIDKAELDLRSRMVFRPMEVIHGTLPVLPNGTLDVWTRGGTYWQYYAGGFKQPHAPAEILGFLRPGMVCFVAAARFDKSGSRRHGQFWIAGTDTLAKIEHGQIKPIASRSRWIATVLDRARARETATDRPKDEVTLFLNALRRAASKQND